MADLCNLDQVKDYIGMTGSKQLDDDLITDLCGRITSIFQDYCNVTQFDSVTYTEYHDGGGSEFLFPNANIPIISITSIHDSYDWSWDSDSLIITTDYTTVDNFYVALKNSYFSDQIQNVRIIFVGGYVIIPESLVQVAIEETGRRYKHRRDFDTLSKTLEDGTATYAPPGLLQSTKDVLIKYVRAWVQ